MEVKTETAEQYWTLRQRLIREVSGLYEAQLLEEALAFVQQLKARDTPAPRGSAAAVLRHYGTITSDDAQEMMDIINREFNNIEGEW